MVTLLLCSIVSFSHADINSPWEELEEFREIYRDSYKMLVLDIQYGTAREETEAEYIRRKSPEYNQEKCQKLHSMLTGLGGRPYYEAIEDFPSLRNQAKFMERCQGIFMEEALRMGRFTKDFLDRNFYYYD